MEGLIKRGEMFAPMLLASPTFTPEWNAFVAYWRDEPGPLPEYLALAELARHLIARLVEGDTARFGAVFDVVERWIIEGDDYVQEAAIIGLLEGLQNTNLHEARTQPDDFVPWLRPRSLTWWRKVEEFWENGTPLVDN